jgi:HEAT repeat protein
VKTPLGASARDRARAAEAEDLFARHATGELVDRLSDPSWIVRRAVVSALARLGDEAIEPLCDLLRDDRRDESSIAAAVDALVSSLGRVDAAALRLARSPDPAVACDGAQILGRRRTTGALDELARLAHSDNENVALAALEAVGRIGGEPAVDVLIEAVESRSFFRAFPAIDLLGRTGDPRAVRPLAGLLAQPPYAIEAARALGHTGQPAAVRLLAELLERPNDVGVRVAAEALAQIHDQHAERLGGESGVPQALRAIGASVVDRLSQASTSADTRERAAICRVLGWIGGSQAVHTLVGLLDADPDTARVAASSLASLGAEAEAELLLALAQSSSERRLLILPIVGRRSSATAQLIDCLTDPNPSVRALACEALGRTGDERIVPLLFERLGDPDARVSQGAVAAIQAIGGAEVERRAAEIARSGDARSRRPVLRILAYFGSPATLPLFLEAMGDPDDRVRDVAANGLAAIDDERAREALFEASNHPSPRTRATALRGLGQTDPSERAWQRLLAALSDPDAWVRYYSVQALSRLGIRTSAAPIAALLGDPAGHVRVAAIDALARLRGSDALDALHDALTSHDADVVRAALMAVGIVRNPSSIARVTEALRAPDAATRLVALSAIAEFDSPLAIAALSKAASDPDEGVRSAAVNLLSTQPGVPATRALVELASHPGTRDRAAVALSSHVPMRIEGLAESLLVANAEMAAVLVSALVRMRRPEARAVVESALAFENVFVRRAVAAVLSSDVTPRAHELLERAAKVDPDEQVRSICAAVLSG